MTRKINVSSTVHVRLYDGRVIVATVCAVEETVAGTKVRVKSGDCTLKVRF
jgi:hypothetical protein